MVTCRFGQKNAGRSGKCANHSRNDKLMSKFPRNDTKTWKNDNLLSKIDEKRAYISEKFQAARIKHSPN